MSVILLRILGIVPTLAGVVIATFFITRILPGDPAVFFTSNPTASPAAIEAVRQQLGLDQPLWRQFLIYVWNLLHGDLGNSILTGQPVTRDILAKLPASVELTACAFLLAVVIAVPLGIAAALRAGTAIDHVCRFVSTLGVSLPTFVTGLLLIYVFYYQAGLSPEPIGQLDPFVARPPRVTGFLLADALIAGRGDIFAAALGQLILPALTMAIFALAPLARMTRAAMLGTLNSEFIRTARANGLRRRTIVYAYAMRNALLPIITTVGMVFSYMLSANVLVERVFAWPGIGSYALDALLSLDYAPVQGFVLVMAAIFVLVNLLVDVAYSLVDPRTAVSAR